ncbi:hypothetical protein KSD_43920 [Ktedonobacter sp. SOSP1-85]|uniref:ISAzo13-like element transposase-related protein n=1 Tax=Ktedonobacter sp. SOSP1-85 TaxID=2778367 RepID=UPI001A23E525|nr:hypothetical protein [Ktedonobacter sp. SOSP1-85]GHO76621.1 hypothetical protein KSD_43920 [Ktedonobacter sp. SOSP1-85]
MNEEADADAQTLRISMGAKAAVKVGPFARGGKSRVRTNAADHDFQPEAMVTPVGIFLPASDELFLYAVTSKVTSDCLVDRLIDWWESVRERFPHIKTLLINLDNGPENHSRRTQFMQRLLEFVHRNRRRMPLPFQAWGGMRRSFVGGLGERHRRQLFHLLLFYWQVDENHDIL